MEKFSHEAPIKPSVLVSFRKRLTADYLMEANEYILEISGVTKEHKTKNESKNAKAANTLSDNIENLGTEILDATCSPSNIRYPQDFSLLNEAREKFEDMVDYFHKNFHPWDKPRTYHRIARKEYLALAKSKKRTEKKVRATIRKQLGYVRRDLEYLENYMEEGYALDTKYFSERLSMNDTFLFDLKQTIDNCISEIDSIHWMFYKNPKSDFFDG